MLTLAIDRTRAVAFRRQSGASGVTSFSNCSALAAPIVATDEDGAGDTERAEVEEQQALRQSAIHSDGRGGAKGPGTHDWMHHFSRPRFLSPVMPRAPSGMGDAAAATAPPFVPGAAPERRRSYPAQPPAGTSLEGLLGAPVRLPLLPHSLCLCRPWNLCSCCADRGACKLPAVPATGYRCHSGWRQPSVAPRAV